MHREVSGDRDPPACCCAESIDDDARHARLRAARRGSLIHCRYALEKFRVPARLFRVAVGLCHGGERSVGVVLRTPLLSRLDRDGKYRPRRWNDEQDAKRDSKGIGFAEGKGRAKRGRGTRRSRAQSTSSRIQGRLAAKRQLSFGFALNSESGIRTPVELTSSPRRFVALTAFRRMRPLPRLPPLIGIRPIPLYSNLREAPVSHRFWQSRARLFPSHTFRYTANCVFARCTKPFSGIVSTIARVTSL